MQFVRVAAGVGVALAALTGLDSGAAQPPRSAIAYRAPAGLTDRMEMPAPSEVRLEDGFLGVRVANNEKNRLLAVDEDALLAGFRHRPGSQAWIGEHVGKFLHAATLAWANTGDAKLRAKIDRVTTELIKTQEPDGYLGTYTPDKRFGLYPGADWDVWVHKYDLIGLLTYHQYTGSKQALDAARKIGDLLVQTFGPGKKSILAAGTHVGMAATSVLEPIVLLYRTTGDERYLDFARAIVQAWDAPNGPKIVQTLTTERAVDKTANGKAYEMLSNLVGLCELARATGDRALLVPVENAWEDVVHHQLYVTGGASWGEHFHATHDLPNGMGANVGETCVTVTWIQLNAQLLRLTGDARYGDEMERSYYNHLAAAQRPDGSEWCYYTSLEGTKPYGPGINCCVSSGPRGMALAPQLTYLTTKKAGVDGLAVNLFEPSRLTTRLGGQVVTVEQQTEFPRRGGATLTFRMDKPATFALQIRAPAWTETFGVRATGDVKDASGPRQGAQAPLRGWATIPARRWKNGDRVIVSFAVPTRIVPGGHGNENRVALQWGPLVLAYDAKRNPDLPPARALGLSDVISKPPFTPVPGAALAFAVPVRNARDAKTHLATFVPFAEAGADGGRYQVWLRASGAPGLKNDDSLFAFGEESRSRAGNVEGEIADGDTGTFVVTFNGEKRDEDWFAVSVEKPVLIRRIVFAHGRTFHDGGWFDSRAGKPRVQIRRAENGDWETIDTLDDYPATTATNPRGLRDGQTFTLRLSAAQKAVAVRVIGKPAPGDNANQAFVSCAELAAFAN